MRHEVHLSVQEVLIVRFAARTDNPKHPAPTPRWPMHRSTSPEPTRPHRSAGRADWSDEDLLLLARSGDSSAFAEIYRRYEAPARRYARSIVGRDDVDDVIAESFAKMLRALKAGRGPADHPVRYLMVTVRTTAITHSTRSNKHRLVSQPDPSGIADGPSLSDPDLIESFRALQPRWRQIIWWTEIEERSIPEIAETLGLTPPAVSALAYRARRALRDEYRQRCARTDADL